jgi:Protein of unknown function (DUF3662)/Inner membrane component of T3SS, cytoplasmic domain
MSILRDFEKRLEGAVEGFFARAFRSGLQPVELAKALQRYAANYQQVDIEGVFVPNVFRFTLAPDDVERFSGFSESLTRELADVVRRTAEDRNWHTKGPVRVEIESAPHVLVGTYELRGKAEAAPVVPVAAQAAAVERDLDPTPLPDPNPGSLRIVAGGEMGAEFPLSAVTVIGRLPECEVTLDDPSVSRKHARITRQGDRWMVEDLGSTNGMRINGTQIGQSELRDGDRLELGTVKLMFSTGVGRRSPTRGAAGANGRGS